MKRREAEAIIKSTVPGAVRKAIAETKGAKKKAAAPAPRESVYDPGGYAAASVKAAAGAMAPMMGPIPSSEQIHEHGGGVLGFIRAKRSIQRSDT